MDRKYDEFIKYNFPLCPAYAQPDDLFCHADKPCDVNT